MIQTAQETPPGPYSDPVPVGAADPDPSGIRTAPRIRTPHYSDPARQDSDRTHSDPARPDPNHSDSDPGPDDRGPGPSPDTTRAPTIETRTPTTRTVAETITGGPSPDGPGLDAIRTRTLTGATRVAKNLHHWLAEGGYLNALTAVVAVVASLGQKEYAKTKAHFVNQIDFGGFDLTPWLAPVVFDVSVAALLGGGLHWAKKRHSPWPWWIAAAGIAGLSVFTNLQHTGRQITAPASGGLFLIWFLRLFFEYKQIRRDREIQDSASDEFRSTDMLFDVNKRLAKTAWTIAREKPLEAGLAYRHALGDTLLTKRDLAIMLARHANTIYDDRLYFLTNPAPSAAAPAGSGKDTDAKRRTARKIRWWNRKRLAEARRRALMAAEDEVDRFLGLKVIERTGILIQEVTYQQQAAPTALLAKPAVRSAERRRELGPQDQDPLPALPAARGRRRVAASVPTSAVEDDVVDATEIVEVIAPDGAVHQFEKPAGMAGINWKPLAEIKGLPGYPIDPTLDCRCSSNPAKPCAWKLVDHVMRRGTQVEAVIQMIGDWADRPERIAKPDVEVAGVPSSSGQVAVAGVMNHLRMLYVSNAEKAALTE